MVVYLFPSFFEFHNSGMYKFKKTFKLLHTAYIATAREAVTVSSLPTDCFDHVTGQVPLTVNTMNEMFPENLSLFM